MEEERDRQDAEREDGDERLTPDSDEAKKAETEEEAEDEAAKQIDEAFE
jgi:hypothetical protein